MTKILNLSEVALYAWIGFDEAGKSGIGIKQALTPMGMIPLVGMRRDRMEHPILIDQLEAAVRSDGINKVLCRFKFEGVERVVNACRSKE